jgi:hypothetical protein
MTELLYGGIAALQRAIRFVFYKSTALDVSCGSSGRFIKELLKNGFTPTGVDISPRPDYPRHIRRLKNDNSSRTNG